MRGYRARVFQISFLTLIFSFCQAGGAGCGDDSTGNGTDGGVNDGGLPDGQTDDAWIFECPEQQPADHVCIAGHVADVVTDEEVDVPGVSMMRRYEPETDVPNYPRVLQDETLIHGRGKFVFPSVPAHFLMSYPWDVFDLELSVVVPGYTVPVNRYGRTFDQTQTVYLKYYVISEETAATWEGNWLPCDDTGGPIGLDVGAPFKTVVSACYRDEAITTWAIPKTGMVPSLARPYMGTRRCGQYLLLDRLTFSGNSDDAFMADNASGLAVTFIETMLTESQETVLMCSNYNYSSRTCYFPLYGQVGPYASDPGGPVTVIHCMF